MIIHIAICDGCSRRDEMDLMAPGILPDRASPILASGGSRWLLPIKWVQKSVYQAPDQHFCSRKCAAVGQKGVSNERRY